MKTLHAFGVDTAIQQVEYQPFARKRVEQATQGLDIRQFGEIHQFGLPGQDEFTPGLAGAFHRRLRNHDDVVHRLVHRVAQFVEVRNDLVADLRAFPCRRIVR